MIPKAIFAIVKCVREELNSRAGLGIKDILHGEGMACIVSSDIQYTNNVNNSYHVGVVRFYSEYVRFVAQRYKEATVVYFYANPDFIKELVDHIEQHAKERWNYPTIWLGRTR